MLDEEQAAFADWINDMLADDEVKEQEQGQGWGMIRSRNRSRRYLFPTQDVKHKLPMSLDGKDMYSKMDDGVVLCKVT